MTSSVNSSTNPYAALNGTTGSTSGTGNSNTDTSAQGIQDRFLKLLVTQLQAQDPMNPMDNSQITSQMAQISQVSGMQTLNTAMQSLVQSQAANQSLMAATMIGKQALVPGNALGLTSGSNVQGAVNLSGAATDYTVSIADANGNVVDTLTVKSPSSGLNSFNWDGTDANGKQLPSGKYTFSAKATSASSAAVTATPYANQAVTAVSWASGSPQLIMKDGTSVGLANVAQLS
ncbi:flagellar hook capping protein [Aquitalea sp. FJL05]|uniref:flagellar hook assembly protein FlgD n=1 Tax=Aquitalea sp. FJL05 TaxID=2153366 RepID=UPI000F592F96|nr:flagellar hook capping FlgD N-terminal domain-containing protein [Aquitalea sp. FJL05]RQO73055.1 flagellar hook capping protein [Aquitalea sp. FJL05]